jgi:hypothetical protein
VVQEALEVQPLLAKDKLADQLTHRVVVVQVVAVVVVEVPVAQVATVIKIKTVVQVE